MNHSYLAKDDSFCRTEKNPAPSPNCQTPNQNQDFDNLSDDEKIDIVSRQLLEQNKEAFLELAK